ncbi:hypothetical protein B0H11DRAFT_1940594 [Mycena galericulata]|nr:hypothetical protein B0H11DRAFT_1940594 [Mycena galericulata]
MGPYHKSFNDVSRRTEQGDCCTAPLMKDRQEKSTEMGTCRWENNTLTLEILYLRRMCALYQSFLGKSEGHNRVDRTTKRGSPINDDAPPSMAINGYDTPQRTGIYAGSSPAFYGLTSGTYLFNLFAIPSAQCKGGNGKRPIETPRVINDGGDEEDGARRLDLNEGVKGARGFAEEKAQTSPITIPSSEQDSVTAVRLCERIRSVNVESNPVAVETKWKAGIQIGGDKSGATGFLDQP